MFSVEVTDIFFFDTEFDYFRTEQPIPREDGSVPQSNDYQLIGSRLPRPLKVTLGRFGRLRQPWSEFCIYFVRYFIDKI